MTDPAQITDIFRKLKNEFGKLDIFVSNARPAAPTFFQPPLDITLQQWDAAFDSQAKAFLVVVPKRLNGNRSAGQEHSYVILRIPQNHTRAKIPEGNE